MRVISLQSFELRGGIMPNLIVRNVPEDVIKALKKRAGRHGTSAEAEHRKILTQALLKTRKRSFAEAIAAMPNVGKDSDFERVQDQHSPDVLD
jgi:antitoxin FitA